MTVSNPVLFESERSGDGLTLRLRGGWCIDHLREIESSLAQLSDQGRHIKLDFSGIETLDLSGAWLLRNWLERAKSAGGHFEVVGERPSHFAFLDELLAQKTAKPGEAAPTATSLRDAVVLDRPGRGSARQTDPQRQSAFSGGSPRRMVRSMRSAHHLRLPSIVRHIYETGIQAIPIVALIAFLISVIVAYLGSQQLQNVRCGDLHRRSGRDLDAA